LEPQGDVITALKEGVILTLVTFQAARDSRLHVSVWGLPYTERYCFRPSEITRPEIHGTQPKAQGEVLDRDAALKEIDRLNQQLQQLEMAAEQAQ
ncbi:type VI secretion system tip protein VgrG, partial [Enterobacter kobei]|nr:type VI secretion system tip protein VgrG [Enterobacter kobei]